MLSLGAGMKLHFGFRFFVIMEGGGPSIPRLCMGEFCISFSLECRIIAYLTWCPVDFWCRDVCAGDSNVLFL